MVNNYRVRVNKIILGILFILSLTQTTAYFSTSESQEEEEQRGTLETINDGFLIRVYTSILRRHGEEELRRVLEITSRNHLLEQVFSHARGLNIQYQVDGNSDIFFF